MDSESSGKKKVVSDFRIFKSNSCCTLPREDLMKVLQIESTWTRVLLKTRTVITSVITTLFGAGYYPAYNPGGCQKLPKTHKDSGSLGEVLISFKK